MQGSKNSRARKWEGCERDWCTPPFSPLTVVGKSHSEAAETAIVLWINVSSHSAIILWSVTGETVTVKDEAVVISGWGIPLARPRWCQVSDRMSKELYLCFHPRKWRYQHEIHGPRRWQLLLPLELWSSNAAGLWRGFPSAQQVNKVYYCGNSRIVILERWTERYLSQISVAVVLCSVKLIPHSSLKYSCWPLFPGATGQLQKTTKLEMLIEKLRQKSSLRKSSLC